MTSRLNAILLQPHMTEKSMDQKAHQNVHVFKVRKDANKIEIKEAIEKFFEVEVDKITTSNVKNKKKRMGRYEGKVAAWKKAYVTIKPGSGEIEYFEGT